MSAQLLFVMAVLLHATFPIAFATLRTSARLTLLYVYIGSVLVVGGFLGAVYVLPVTDSVSVSAGSVAYGALMMSTVLLVIVGRDIEIVRNVVQMVVVLNIFKLVLFGLTSTALDSDHIINPNDTASAVFSQSLRSVVVGGGLIIAELLLLVVLFERIKRWDLAPGTVEALYVLSFIGVLCLDGLLFPALALTPTDALGDVIRSGVQSKLLLATAFAVPLLAFLGVFRRSLAAYEATPLSLRDLFHSSRDELLREIGVRDAELEVRRQELESKTGAFDRRVSITRSIAAIEADGPIDDCLAELGRALGGIDGVLEDPPGLVVFHEGDVAAIHGQRAGAMLAPPAEVLASADRRPWRETRPLGTVACIPLVLDRELAGLLEVPVSLHSTDSTLAALTDLSVELESALRPAVTAARERWVARRPVMSLLDGSRTTHGLFQPVVSLADRAVHSYEGLIRFDPGISPEERFREAAALGLGIDLELLAVSVLMAEAEALPPGTPVALNVSSATIVDERLASHLAGRGRPIVLELTEHDRVESYEAVAEAIAAMGDVRLCVDDAGSGYASLQHILRLQPSLVKLDRVWVAGIEHDRPRQVVVKGLQSFVEEIGATLVAEGVETPAAAETLMDLDVPLAQGYLFGRPAPVSNLVSKEG